MWSFRIGQILGIEIRVHFLFVALLAFIALAELVHGNIVGAFLLVILLLFAFGFVLLHELGHCIAAMYYKIPVRDITLWPLGGIASIASLPQNPKIEIHIALAGPFVNLILAILLAPVALVTYLLSHSFFFVHLVAFNLILLLFNLIPAFPMDGGRVYRAWKALQIGYLEATRQAFKLSTIVAAILVVLGILTDFWLVLIAIFILLAGQEELAMLEWQYQARQSSFYGWNIPRYYFFYIDPKLQTKSQQSHFYSQNQRMMEEWLRKFFHRN